MEYNIVPQEYDQTLIGSIASKMSMAGETKYINTESYPDTYMLKEDSGKTLRYETKTGVLKYTNPSAAYLTVSSKPNSPSDANAVSIAKNLLIQTGLPANEIKETIVTYDTQGHGEKDTGKILYEWTTTKTVYFERQINGVTLPDTIKVTIGENGDIASFTIPMKTLEPVNK